MVVVLHAPVSQSFILSFLLCIFVKDLNLAATGCISYSYQQLTVYVQLPPDILHSHQDGRPLGEIMLPGNQIIKHPVDPQNDPGRYKMEIIRK